jgi:hypothetical protein
LLIIDNMDILGLKGDGVANPVTSTKPWSFASTPSGKKMWAGLQASWICLCDLFLVDIMSMVTRSCVLSRNDLRHHLKVSKASPHSSKDFGFTV